MHKQTIPHTRYYSEIGILLVRSGGVGNGAPVNILESTLDLSLSHGQNFLTSRERLVTNIKYFGQNVKRAVITLVHMSAI